MWQAWDSSFFLHGLDTCFFICLDYRGKRLRKISQKPGKIFRYPQKRGPGSRKDFAAIIRFLVFPYKMCYSRKKAADAPGSLVGKKGFCLLYMFKVDENNKSADLFLGAFSWSKKVIPEDIQTLFEAARWTLTHQNRRKTLRQLAKTEENYLLLVRELDRVEGQCLQARALHAEATLTLVEWLETLNAFHWLCAYCRHKPFQVMSHILPLPQGGTTATNCVPACYHCLNIHKRTSQK